MTETPGRRAHTVVRGRIAVLAALLLMAGAVTSLRPTLARLSSQTDVKVERDASGPAVRYRVVDGDCDVTWVVDDRTGVIAHRPECPGPFARQLGPASKLAARVFADPGASRLHTIFIGGLTGLPELSARLASVANQSADWDPVGGRPRSGPLNPFVAALIQDGRVLAPWQDVFAAVQRQVRVSSVEQVRVSRAGDLPFYDLLRNAKVQASARVPYNCVVWLSLTPGNQRSSPIK